MRPDNRTMAACEGGERLPLHSSIAVKERKRRGGEEGCYRCCWLGTDRHTLHGGRHVSERD